MRNITFTWPTAVVALVVGIISLAAAWTMVNGWNPYELAPILQQAQAGLSCVVGLVFVGLGVYGIVRLVRGNSATNGH